MSAIYRKYFLILFLFLLSGDLLANVTGNGMMNLIFKPLLVTSLLVYLFSHPGASSSFRGFAIAGLCLSLSGDCLLIFQTFNGLFFIGGLLSFLCAHVFFILYYIRSSAGTSSRKLKGKSLFILMFALYGAGFSCLLYSHLGTLKVPVFAYAAVLISMNLFALNRYGKVSGENFSLVMSGALLFTVSDSLLAVNKFVFPLPLAGVWIMATYATAQYLITRSILPEKTVLDFH